MSTVDLLFWIFAALSVGGGLSMVLSRHPVSAAMFMIVSLVGVAALFVLLESFFLAVSSSCLRRCSYGFIFIHYHALDVGPGASKINLSNWKTGLIGFGTSCLLIFLLSALFLLMKVPHLPIRYGQSLIMLQIHYPQIPFSFPRISQRLDMH